MTGQPKARALRASCGKRSLDCFGAVRGLGQSKEKRMAWPTCPTRSNAWVAERSERFGLGPRAGPETLPRSATFAPFVDGVQADARKPASATIDL